MSPEDFAALISRPDWVADAACRDMDTELFYPDRGDHHTVKAAKAVCAGCDVAEQCRDYSFANRERVGIWGGLTENQRRKARKEAGAVGNRRHAEHGTNSRYQRGCRCEPCTEARRTYMRDYRHSDAGRYGDGWATRGKDYAGGLVSDDPRRQRAADALWISRGFSSPKKQEAS